MKTLNHTQITTWVCDSENNIKIFKRVIEKDTVFYKIIWSSEKKDIGVEMTYAKMVNDYHPQPMAYKIKGLAEFMTVEYAELYNKNVLGIERLTKNNMNFK